MEEILIISGCLLLNAFLSSYEMAFVSISKPELRRLARTGDKHAQRLLVLREQPERTLSVIQIGITLVGAIAAAIGGAGASENIVPIFVDTFGMRETTAEVLSVVLVVIPLTYLSVVIGELVPKTLALRNPAKIVLAGAKILFLADRIFSPVVTVLEWSTKRIMRIFFSRGKNFASVPQTTVEIDALSPAHQQFVLNMANIEKKLIRDILLPWVQVNFVSSSDALDQVMRMVFTSGHTRLPVIDNGGVIGILHTKEFLAFRETGEVNWSSIIRPVLKIQTTDSVLGILRMMQDKRNHMAVVFTSSGERTGIVTLEDIIEEIVGDIFDEDDDGRVRKVFAAKTQARVIPKEG